MNQQETRSLIRQVLADHAKLLVDVDSLSDDADLYAAGLASFASINVMIALEDRLDIEFPETMLQRSVFQSVDSMAAALDTIAAGV